MLGIYKITSPSGRVYIGQSRNLAARLKRYKHPSQWKTQLRLRRSFEKHGVDAHTFEIVHELPSDVEQEVLDRYEQLYMDCYRNAGVELLNIREAGSKGKLSEETKNKLRQAHFGLRTGYKHTDETKEKIRRSNAGRKKSPETISKMRVAAKGRTLTPEHRRAISVSLLTTHNAKKQLCP